MALPSAVTHITGRGLVLRGADIDTDRIMPARYLKAVTFEGLERQLFADDRIAANGTHPFDSPPSICPPLLRGKTHF